MNCLANLLLLICTVPLTAVAGDTDKVAGVRIKLETASPVWVGQKVSFNVDLMSSTFFSGTPRFELPDVSGAFLMKVEGSPTVGSETIDGETWSFQRHEFSIYPHRAGEFVVPGIPVRFSVAPAFGKPPQLQQWKTEIISFTAKMPAGAEGQSMLISTSELDVRETWSPTISKDGELELEVGDAITRRITLAARDIPGMALPAIRLPQPQGMSAYANEPEVSDQSNRGELTGSRTDSVTFVCQRAGTIEMPALVITWWNTTENELKRVTLPAVTVVVVESQGDPITTVESLSAGTGSKVQSLDARQLIVGLLLVIALAIAAVLLREPIKRRLNYWQQKRDNSESVYFAKIKNACLGKRPAETFNAMTRWLERISDDRQAVTIGAFAQQNNDPDLAKELDKLQRAVVERSESWSGETLLRQLEKARRRKLRPESWLKKEALLPELNPTGHE